LMEVFFRDPKTGAHGWMCTRCREMTQTGWRTISLLFTHRSQIPLAFGRLLCRGDSGGPQSMTRRDRKIKLELALRAKCDNERGRAFDHAIADAGSDEPAQDDVVPCRICLSNWGAVPCRST